MTALATEYDHESNENIAAPAKTRAREVDLYVGQRIRERRTMMGLT